MKAELTLPPELVQEIALQVTELLKPIIACNGRRDAEDRVFDKKSLAEYLHLSESTINKLVSNKQISYFKIQQRQSGGVRFYKRDIDKWIARHTIPEINCFTGRLDKRR